MTYQFECTIEAEVSDTSGDIGFKFEFDFDCNNDITFICCKAGTYDRKTFPETVSELYAMAVEYNGAEFFDDAINEYVINNEITSGELDPEAL